jgi:hypothetical protein
MFNVSTCLKAGAFLFLVEYPRCAVNRSNPSLSKAGYGKFGIVIETVPVSLKMKMKRCIVNRFSVCYNECKTLFILMLKKQGLLYCS